MTIVRRARCKTWPCSVFAFYEDRACHGLDEVLKRYAEITPYVNMSGTDFNGKFYISTMRSYVSPLNTLFRSPLWNLGPTNFGPLIRQAIRIVREERKVRTASKHDV